MRTLRRISCSLLLSTGIERFLKRCKKTNLSLCLSLSLVLLNLDTKRKLLSLHAAFSSIQTDREAWKLSTLLKYSTLRSLRLVIFEKPAPFLPFEKLGRAGSCFSRSSNCFEAEKIHRCARFKKGETGRGRSERSVVRGGELFRWFTTVCRMEWKCVETTDDQIHWNA